jgi:hypothetical protein
MFSSKVLRISHGSQRGLKNLVDFIDQALRYGLNKMFRKYPFGLSIAAIIKIQGSPFVP